MAKVTIAGKEFETIDMPTQNTRILMVRGEKGSVGCGYFDVQAANRVGDSLAIATGVQSIDQLLAAKIVRLSDQARTSGALEGITAKEALLLMNP